MKPLHIATSPLTNRIFAGNVLKCGTAWAANKQDVTGAACGAVCEHVMANGGTVAVSANGKPKFEITVRDVEVAGAQHSSNLDMDRIERENDLLKEEVDRLRNALELIADQYEPRCSDIIPSIARTALNAAGAYGQKVALKGWPTAAMTTAFATVFNVRDQKNTFGPAFRAALAAIPKGRT